MPRINTNPGHDTIINEHNLRRDQAARQLQILKGWRMKILKSPYLSSQRVVEAAINDLVSLCLFGSVLHILS